jgi:hypothetical protein
MALTATDAEPVRSAKRVGYAIKMMSGNQIVPVIVTDEALQDIASPPEASLERLRQYRSQIEEVASRKHSLGQIETDGSVCVTSKDLSL